MTTIMQLPLELEPEGSLERRVIDAADACVRRWGWAKTTMSDIAVQASMSRASVYRAFPGGRDAIYAAVRRQRQITFFEELLVPLSSGGDLLTVMSDTIVVAACSLRDDEQFQYQLLHEPGALLRELTFDGLDRVLGLARAFVAPHLARFVELREAERLAEWATRIVVSYTLEPGDYVDLTDEESVRSFVQSRALKGIDSHEPAHPSLPRPESSIPRGVS